MKAVKEFFVMAAVTVALSLIATLLYLLYIALVT